MDCMSRLSSTKPRSRHIRTSALFCSKTALSRAFTEIKRWLKATLPDCTAKFWPMYTFPLASKYTSEPDENRLPS
eukprot:scaffold2144_cov334-Prasinococcus_capsulatus_cf.AAC.9